MRRIPQSSGGRHGPDYTAASFVAVILSEDVHLSDDIPMADKSAGTFVDATGRSVSFPAKRALLARPCLILERRIPAETFRLVREHVPDTPCRRLVHPLVLNLALVIADPDIPEIADHQRSHASFMERVYRRRGQFVFDIPDLVVDPFQLLLLRLDEPPASLSSFLFSVDLGRQFRLQLLPVTALGTKNPTIQDQVEIFGAHTGRMDLAEVAGSDQSIFLCCNLFLIRGSEFVLASIPPDLDLNGKIEFPVLDDKRIGSLRVREDEITFDNSDGSSLPNHLKELLGLVRRPDGRIRLPFRSPSLEGREEALDRLLGRLRMKDRGLAILETFLHSVLGKPDIISTDMPPEPDQTQRVDAPRFPTETFENLGLAQLHLADNVDDLYTFVSHCRSFPFKDGSGQEPMTAQTVTGFDYL